MLWVFADELQFRCGAIATKPGETRMQIVHKTEEVCFTARREMKTAQHTPLDKVETLEEASEHRERVTSVCKLAVNRG